MRGIRNAVAIATVSALLSGGMAFTQDHHDQDRHDQHDRDHHDQDRHDQDHHDQGYHDHYVHHNDWRRGGHIDRNDWQRGRQFDWHAHHLRRPPQGYEWREVDGNYVMAAVATGVIASIIIAANSH
jgi:Ni/Co efflux regulator RcnB